MSRGRPPQLGQITFKLGEKLHRQVLAIAHVMGTDVSGILRQMLTQYVPEWALRAAEIRKRTEEAQAAFAKTRNHTLG